MPMQDLQSPCYGSLYGTPNDLAAGTAIAPHGLAARVLCGYEFLSER